MFALAASLFAMLAAAGCSRTNDSATAQAKAENETLKSDLAKAIARADAAESELAKLKAVQVQPKPSEADRKAAEWALRVGGMVRVFLDGVVNEYPKDGKLPDGPFNVIFLDLNKPAGEGKLTNEGMKYIEGLKHLKELHMNGANLDDFSFLKGMERLETFHGAPSEEGLNYLKALPKLKDIEIGFYWGNPKITDVGILNFRGGFPSLEALYMSSCNKVTDAGFQGLRDLKKLKSLSLFGTQITDAGLQHLSGLEELRELNLERAPVSGPGLEHLKKLSKLTNINLGATRMADAGLVHLVTLPKLEWVSLAYQKEAITDAGLAHLKGMSKLKYLSLKDTKVTDAGVADLKKSLPNCQIEHK